MNIFRADPSNVGDAFCPPFIYFPFKDKPYYLNKYFIDDQALDSAKIFPNALEESRNFNFIFYKHIYEKYGGV